MTELPFKRCSALIGVGRWGRNIARNLDELGALHTICDTVEGTLDVYQKEYPNVTFTSNFRRVLENEEITRLFIAAPAVQHYKLARAALLAGKDVFVEKPLCLDCCEAEELIQIAENRGLVLMVGHLLQFHPCVTKVQEMIGTGQIGKVQYISSTRLNLGSIRTEENALWNFAPHDVSVILSLCGYRLPQQIRCVGAAYVSEGVADTTMTMLKFEGDVRAHIYVSWLNPFKEQKLVVVGSSGMIVFDDTKTWKEKLVYFPSHVQWHGGHTPHFNEKESEVVEVIEEEPLKQECLHFLTCCDERTTPRTDGHEGLRVLKVLQAAQASMNEDGHAKDPTQKHSTQDHLFNQYYAHPSSVIDSGAIIGNHTKIWHFTHVMEGAVIGERCHLGQNVVVAPKVVLGKNVKVQNNVSLYTGVTCEDEVFIGPSAVFTNVINPRSAIERKEEYQNTTLRKGVTIGANATIICGIELGEYAFVGSGAVVTRDISPYAVVVGNPSRQIGWMSRAGERLDLPVEGPKGETLTAICPSSKELYILKEGQVFLKSTHEQPLEQQQAVAI